MSIKLNDVLRKAALLIIAVGVVAGCSTPGPIECDIPEGLDGLSDKEKIAVPDDLDNLDATKALKIPKATTPPRQEGDKCLDFPPRITGSGV